MPDCKGFSEAAAGGSLMLSSGLCWEAVLPSGQGTRSAYVPKFSSQSCHWFMVCLGLVNSLSEPQSTLQYYTGERLPPTQSL